MTPHAAALARADMFRGLSEPALERLAQRTVERQYGRGQVLFVRGDVGDSMLLVLEGLLKVYDSSPEGAELLLSTVGAGGTVGALALADGGARSASVAALHPTRVLLVGRADFLELVRRDGSVAEPLLCYLSAHLRRLTDLAGDLVFLGLPQRVAKLLTGLADRDGKRVPEGVLLDLPLTQSEIAAMVGTSRQSLNTVLGGFVREGLIELRGRQIVLLRPDAVADRAAS